MANHGYYRNGGIYRNGGYVGPKMNTSIHTGKRVSSTTGKTYESYTSLGSTNSYHTSGSFQSSANDCVSALGTLVGLIISCCSKNKSTNKSSNKEEKSYMTLTEKIWYFIGIGSFIGLLVAMFITNVF